VECGLLFVVDGLVARLLGVDRLLVLVSAFISYATVFGL
jgi:hypothetical protein